MNVKFMQNKDYIISYNAWRGDFKNNNLVLEQSPFHSRRKSEIVRKGYIKMRYEKERIPTN